ncbi:MAG: PH domain-containing protein [Clostridia bacterium]|nr:PH domain-containing protein [Clostridia bacterium]
MKTYLPPKSTLIVWQIRVTVLLALLVAVLYWFIADYFLVLFCVSLVLAVVFNLIYFPAFLRCYSISVNQNAIIIKSGVFIKHERILPFPRMIYAEKQQTLVAKAFSVSALVLRVARAATLTVELKDNDIAEIMKAVAKWQ